MNILRRIAAVIEGRDIMFFAGVGLCGYGAWRVDPSLGFFVAGAIFVSVAVFGVRR